MDKKSTLLYAKGCNENDSDRSGFADAVKVARQADVVIMSDFYLEDGAYFRIKTLQIGYSLPKALIHKVSIDKVRVYLTSNNLFTLTKYTGFDPEIGGDQGIYGIDRGVYPQARSFMLPNLFRTDQYGSIPICLIIYRMWHLKPLQAIKRSLYSTRRLTPVSST